jgi:C1A family cysteine protease
VRRHLDAGGLDRRRAPAYDEKTAHGGHAVALVGYTPEHVIVRNSWGATQWGDNGFGYASNAYAKEAFTEAYGISVA